MNDLEKKFLKKSIMLKIYLEILIVSIILVEDLDCADYSNWFNRISK